MESSKGLSSYSMPTSWPLHLQVAWLRLHCMVELNWRTASSAAGWFVALTANSSALGQSLATVAKADQSIRAAAAPRPREVEVFALPTDR